MSASTHFIGIGGTGLSAIARVLLERGENVTGSDRENSPLAEDLRQAGATISIGHAGGNVNGATRVIRSSAIPDDNVEVQAALAKGIPVFKRAEMLADLLTGQQVLAVAGSHGKTTTTAMLAWILTALVKNPGYIIGSVSKNLESNASAGGGQFFVIEADEYDHMFLGLNPSLAVITNVEYDHPDFFPSEQDFHSAFRQFADRLQPDGRLLVCADNAGALAVKDYAQAHGKHASTYALRTTEADYLGQELQQIPEKGFAFVMTHESEELARVELQVPGKHNAENALAALAATHMLGLSLDEAASALADFRGTGRRFELRGEVAGILLIDDYAHHPTEIRAALAAARSRYPDRRILTVWQPHTYSRTLTLHKEFSTAFADADWLLIAAVYAAREEQPPDFNLQDLFKDMTHPSAQYASDFAEAEALLFSELKSGDVLLVLSAGDAIQLTSSLHEKLHKKE